MSNANLSDIKDAKEAFQALKEISAILCTGLDSEALSLCVRLCNSGINPEVLALLVKQLQQEMTSLKENTLGDKI